MTASPSTIHDFVLNLLTDPSAKAAFDMDAQSALEQAGLSDISAADVQEVMPLVLDLLPAVDGVPTVEGVSLEGLPALDEGPLGAISQLQAVAAQLTSSGVSLGDLTNTSSAGVIAADEQGLSVWGGSEAFGTTVTPALDVAGDFSAVDDAFGTVTTATQPVADTTLNTLDTATATVDSTAGVVPGTEGILGVTGTVTGLTEGVVNGLGGYGDVHVGSALEFTSLGENANGNVQFESHNTVGSVVDTASGVVDQAGVGGVVSNVTDVAGTTAAPAVDGLGVTDLLF